jgi:hypothetical protein
MGSTSSTPRRRSRGWRIALATLAAAASTALLGGSPARADDDFEDAFERELGRIAAHRVAHAGRHVALAAFGPHRARQIAAHRARHHRNYRHARHHRHHRWHYGDCGRFRCRFDHRGNREVRIRGVWRRADRWFSDRYRDFDHRHRHRGAAVRHRRSERYWH